jgi:hypothetical protein
MAARVFTRLRGSKARGSPDGVGASSAVEEVVMAVEPSLSHRLTAEFIGTFVLVFGGCGTAVLATTNRTSAWAGSASPSPSA